MNNNHFEPLPNRLRRAGARLMQATALALMVMLVMPARAADERAVKTRVPPVYPEIARRLKIAGQVKLSVTVDAQGKVTDVQPLSGNHALSAAAEEAVRKWKFAPGDGIATVEVMVNFAL
ncbi:MAG TPA: energy transducer TonB [Terracidiphilus sp.]|nr:energy transducer TonB [Terracidiphilus sp.]